MREHLVMICRLGATVLAFMTVYAVCGRHPPRKIVGGIREFTGMLAVKSAEVPFIIRLERFVEKNGAKYHFGKKVSAKKLILLSLILFATGLIVGNMISVWVAAAASLAGLLLIWILIPFLNRRDNERMLPDLQVIYRALAMQIRAGVYITDALSEIYSGVKERRLKDGLMKLGGDIIMKTDLFSALEGFQKGFDNRYIDSLCITILQLVESGQASDLLTDIGDQMKDMERSVLEKRKGRLDRSLTFYQLGMLACILGIALYACVNYMLNAAAGL